MTLTGHTGEEINTYSKRIYIHNSAKKLIQNRRHIAAHVAPKIIKQF